MRNGNNAPPARSRSQRKPVVGKPSRQINVEELIGNTRDTIAAALQSELELILTECDAKDVVTAYTLFGYWRNSGDLLQAIDIVFHRPNLLCRSRHTNRMSRRRIRRFQREDPTKGKCRGSRKASHERMYMLVAIDHDGCSLEKQTHELTGEFRIPQQGLIVFREYSLRTGSNGHWLGT